MTKKSDSDFHDSIKKLRNLRSKLCNQQTTWQDAFKVRDFVVCELQDMHEKLSSTEEIPPWCKEKVEHILKEILALPNDKEGDSNV
tara:strand:- start:9420 stop:9677 length:258 start_codon:yes stop_codon:yes gene_type:complete